MATSLTYRAYAKINLHLRVGQRDAESGYHALETVFQTIALSDQLILRTAEDVRLGGDLGGAPGDRSNLVLRAARLLKDGEGYDSGVAIELRKAIPIQGGLAGGSTDCAATLVGLNYLWKLDLTFDQLVQYAKNLGADVPFLLQGGAAMGTGNGDRLAFLSGPQTKRWVVLILSETGISTQEAFGALDEDEKAPDVTLAKPQPSTVLREMADAWGSGAIPTGTMNSFEKGVFRLRPRLGELVTSLRESGAQMAHLSGTGPTVYGVFRDETAARVAHQALAVQPGERSVVTHTVEATPVLQS